MEATNRPPNFISLQKLQKLRIKEQEEQKRKQKEEEQLRIKEQEELKVKQKEEEERTVKQKVEEERTLRKVKGHEVKGKEKMLGDEEIIPPRFHHQGRRNKERPLSVNKDGEMSSKSSEQQSVDLEKLRRMKNKEKKLKLKLKMKMKMKSKLKMEMEKTLADADDENVDGKEKEKKLIDEKNNEGVSVNPMVEIVVDEKKVVKQITEVNRKGSNGGRRRSKGKRVSSAEIVRKKTSDGALKNPKVQNVVDDEKKVECAVEKERNEVVTGESSRNGGNRQWKAKPNNRNVKKVVHNPTVEIVEKIEALKVGGDVVKTIGQYCDKSTVETKVGDGQVKMKGEDCNRSKVEMNGCDLGFRRRFGYGGRGGGRGGGRRDENVMWVKKGENEEEESGGGGHVCSPLLSSGGGRMFSGGCGPGKY